MTTFDFGDGNGPVAAHVHMNGMGWVADTATVPPEAYIGGYVYGNAEVRGLAAVKDSAHVYGNALISGSATISGDARASGWSRVLDFATLTGNATITDNVTLADRATVYGNAVLRGHTTVRGDACVHGNARLWDGRDNAFEPLGWRVGPHVCGKARIYGDAELRGPIKVDDLESFSTGVWVGNRIFASSGFFPENP